MLINIIIYEPRRGKVRSFALPTGAPAKLSPSYITYGLSVGLLVIYNNRSMLQGFQVRCSTYGLEPRAVSGVDVATPKISLLQLFT